MKYMLVAGALYVAACLGLIGAMALQTYAIIYCQTDIVLPTRR